MSIVHSVFYDSNIDDGGTFKTLSATKLTKFYWLNAKRDEKSDYRSETLI